MINKNVRWLLLVTLFGSLIASKGADENTLENREAGFRITKPVNWQVLPATVVAKNLALPRLRDKELENVIRSKPDIPFLVIARFREPYDGINPCVQVSFRTQGELLGKGPGALLDRTVERLKSNFRDLAFIEDVTETTVDGQPAARMAAKYTVTDANGKAFQVQSRMWVVPRGEYMLTVSMYAPTEGTNVSEKEFERMFQSIKLTKQ